MLAILDATKWHDLQELDDIQWKEELSKPPKTKDWDTIGHHPDYPLIVRDEGQLKKWLGKNGLERIENAQFFNQMDIKQKLILRCKCKLANKESFYHDKLIITIWWKVEESIVNDKLKSSDEKASRMMSNADDEKKFDVDKMAPDARQAALVIGTQTKMNGCCMVCSRADGYDKTHWSDALFDCWCSNATYCSEKCQRIHLVQWGHERVCEAVLLQTQKPEGDLTITEEGKAWTIKMTKMSERYETQRIARQAAFNPIVNPTYVRLSTLKESQILPTDTLRIIDTPVLVASISPPPASKDVDAASKLLVDTFDANVKLVMDAVKADEKANLEHYKLIYVDDIKEANKIVKESGWELAVRPFPILQVTDGIFGVKLIPSQPDDTVLADEFGNFERLQYQPVELHFVKNPKMAEVRRANDRRNKIETTLHQKLMLDEKAIKEKIITDHEAALNRDNKDVAPLSSSTSSSSATNESPTVMSSETSGPAVPPPPPNFRPTKDRVKIPIFQRNIDGSHSDAEIHWNNEEKKKGRPVLEQLPGYHPDNPIIYGNATRAIKEWADLGISVNHIQQKPLINKLGQEVAVALTRHMNNPSIERMTYWRKVKDPHCTFCNNDGTLAITGLDGKTTTIGEFKLTSCKCGLSHYCSEGCKAADSVRHKSECGQVLKSAEDKAKAEADAEIAKTPAARLKAKQEELRANRKK